RVFNTSTSTNGAIANVGDGRSGTMIWQWRSDLYINNRVRPTCMRPAMRLSLSVLPFVIYHAIGALLPLCTTPAARAEEARINFDRDIRPILSNNCFKCHGPDAKQRKAGLRLDRAEAALAELKSGNRAIVPGKREASALVARITAAEPQERMPPPSSGKKLTP